MNDRELQHLLRMAHEADELARRGSQPVLQLRADVGDALLPAAAPSRRLLWTGLSTLAAAAAVTLVWSVIPASSVPPPIPTPGPLVIADESSDTIEPAPVPSGAPAAAIRLVKGPESGEPEESVLFAIFRDAAGACACVQLEDADWGDRRLADVGRDELLAAALDRPCTDPTGQVLVVGVSGRAGSLPSSQGDAQTIASRLASFPMHDRQDLSLAAYAAMPNLPVGSTVVAESMTFLR